MPSIVHHLSGPNACALGAPGCLSRASRWTPPGCARAFEPGIAGQPPSGRGLCFRFAFGVLSPRRLAHELDSLVRVSRRVGENLGCERRPTTTSAATRGATEVDRRGGTRAAARPPPSPNNPEPRPSAHLSAGASQSRQARPEPPQHRIRGFEDAKHAEAREESRAPPEKAGGVCRPAATAARASTGTANRRCRGSRDPSRPREEAGWEFPGVPRRRSAARRCARDGGLIPTVYLWTVSRTVELSLQSSFQLSLTVLVRYRPRSSI